MDVLLIALAVAGLLVGATGTWSPCGFSMIETIGPMGHDGGRTTTLAACATFAPFAVVGGVATFGALGLAGSLLGGATVAWLVAAVIAAAAAIAEARGIAIAPQVRRQLPVQWRQRMPMPAAAAGYGVLLGLGFTTFMLSYGVWALMGVALAIGEPLAGIVLGVAFGVGRALPIVALAPLADRESGRRACDAMALDPRLLRGARLGDALALAAVAAVLAAGSGDAEAARGEVAEGADPSAAASALVYQLRDGTGELRRGDDTKVPLPGGNPATGGPWIAVTRGGAIRVLERSSLQQAGRLNRKADAVAIAARWLVFRTRDGNRDIMAAARVNRSGRVGKPKRFARVEAPGQLSPPAVDRNVAVFALAKKRQNRLLRQKLRPGGPAGKRALVKSRDAAITTPTVKGKRIAYVYTNRKRQTLKLKGLGKGKGRTIYRHKKGPPTLWTTAISGKRVFFTLVGKGGAGRILSTRR